MDVPAFAKRFIIICGSGFFVLTMPFVALSERLPIRTYTTADGLAFDRVNKIVRDSRGFLWFCTDEGLSRFDGYGFTSYTRQDGLPHQHVNDMVETRGGVYWIATDRGLCRFDPTGARRPPPTRRASSDGAENLRPMFLVYELSSDEETGHVNAVIEDRFGTIWCGTDAGLYRMAESSAAVRFDFVDINGPHEQLDDRRVHAIAEDQRGDLWLGSSSGLYRRRADGMTERYSTRDGLPGDFVQTLFVDRDGTLWAGTRGEGLFVMAGGADAGRSVIARLYTKEDGLPSNRISSVFQSSDGKLWVGTIAGLCEFAQNVPSAGARSLSFVTYDTTNGLSTTDLTALAEDMGHNLWLATRHRGAMRLVKGGLTSFGSTDGLGGGEISSIFEDRAGHLCVTTSGMTTVAAGAINRFDGRRFAGIVPGLKGGDVSYASRGQLTFQDREGEWWVPTRSGLFRFPKVGVDILHQVQPKVVYTLGESHGENVVLVVYEDSRGDVWFSTDSVRWPVARWERATGRIEHYSQTDGLPTSRWSRATSFMEDRAGGLWIGYSNNSGLVRFREGRFRHFTSADGLPSGDIAALHVDGSGRLWIAAGEGGLARVDDPAAAQPRFARYTDSSGLSSDIVWCVTEDARGRVFVGTGRGVDALDPDAGRIVHYSSADGLGSGQVRFAFRDSRGALWFGTFDGLSRLVAQVDEPPLPAPVFITGVRAGGRALGVSQLGQKRLEGLAFSATENRVQIDFVGLGFAAGQVLRYKYRLEGAEPDWSLPGEARSVSYSSLRPGRYRFLVLALGSNGAISESPASVAFEVLPPIWQRWWFITPATMLIAATIYRIYRYRVARLVELERVRVRIATDLHDDIGSSLSRMAILSEVVKQRLGLGAGESHELLNEIAESGRRLVDAMSDIVWSIDPRRDDLSNLAARVREFAAGLLDAKPIKWTLNVPPELDHLRLGPDERRQVFLILKEAITNVARHAGCGSVRMSMAVSGNRLLAEVSDDGCGFSTESPANGSGGEGLESMKSRAGHLGGELSITSAPGRGTCLKLEVPVK